eukprot:scaffold3393_cov101-Isochrysis_galbana.AAC.3
MHSDFGTATLTACGSSARSIPPSDAGSAASATGVERLALGPGDGDCCSDVWVDCCFPECADLPATLPAAILSVARRERAASRRWPDSTTVACTAAAAVLASASAARRSLSSRATSNAAWQARTRLHTAADSRSCACNSADITASSDAPRRTDPRRSISASVRDANRPAFARKRTTSSCNLAIVCAACLAAVLAAASSARRLSVWWLSCRLDTASSRSRSAIDCFRVATSARISLNTPSTLAARLLLDSTASWRLIADAQVSPGGTPRPALRANLKKNQNSRSTIPLQQNFPILLACAPMPRCPDGSRVVARGRSSSSNEEE